MDILNVTFGPPVLTTNPVAMFISTQTAYWPNRLSALMYELMPCVFHPAQSIYEGSLSDLEYLERRCKEMSVQLNVDYSYIQEPEQRIVDTSTKFEYKTKPYDYQVVGVEFGMEHDRFLLADSMGLGKSKQTIDLAVRKKIEKGYKHCLIICGVNGLKWNWESEIKIHSNEKCHILGNRKNSKGKWNVKSSTEKLEDAKNLPEDVYFIITNVETLRNKEIAKVLKKQCDDNNINMIAFDEFHTVTTPDAQQSKGLLKLSAESMVAMTGSPIMNSPLDIYMTLRWLGYDRHCFSDFKNQFCRFGANNEIVGVKNMDQIQNLLNIMMLRRQKEDVLDLPEKTFKVEYVEMSAAQQRIYNEVLNGLRKEVDLIKQAKNPLANLIRLRQATGHTSIISSTISESAKIDRLKQLVKEITDNGKKCIIFSNWTKMTDILQEELKEYNPAVITGDTRDRVEEQNKFTNDPNCKIIIGTIACMGVGLTLTAANTVIFCDEPWTYASFSQACDRAHRIGQKDNVTIISLITKNTIDEKIHQIVEEKRLVSDAMIDNLSCVDINALLNYLLA